MSSATRDDELATTAALALVDCRARAEEAEQARQRATEARNAAVGALYAAGWSLRRIATELDCSHELVRKMVKAHRDTVWGGFGEGYSATPSVPELAVEYRVAREAQERRAEIATGGYAAELDGFYGRPDTPVPDQVEAPIVWADWMRHRSAMLAESAS